MRIPVVLTLLAAFLVAVLACRSTRPPEPVQRLLELPLPSVEALPARLEDAPGDVAPGMRQEVPGCGFVLGHGVSIVVDPQTSPRAGLPWVVSFLWPRVGGQRYLLLADEGGARPLIPGCELVGGVKWTLPLDGWAMDLNEPIGPASRLTLVLPEALLGSQWWVQALWWDPGSQTVALSPGWWFRVGS